MNKGVRHLIKVPPSCEDAKKYQRRKKNQKDVVLTFDWVKPRHRAKGMYG